MLQHAQELDIPCLLTHGTDDYLTSPVASQEFAEKAGENCQFELLQGHLHDPFRDLGREQVLELFVDFVRRQASTAKAISGERS